MKFFIFGRPRSRTAWVANFLTIPGKSLCLHEGLVEANGRVQDLFPGLNTRYVNLGNSDTGLIHKTEEVLLHYPDAKFVVLEGTGLSWAKFQSKYDVPKQFANQVDNDYAKTRRLLAHRALFIDANHLMARVSEATRLWSHLWPGHPLDVERYKMLRNLNIQTDPESLRERMSL